jgi:hypothetical protein
MLKNQGIRASPNWKILNFPVKMLIYSKLNVS